MSQHIHTPTSTLELWTLRLFLMFMVVCACTLLTVIWSGVEKEVLFKTVFTFFVIGLANFLTWLSIVVYRLIDALKQ